MLSLQDEATACLTAGGDGDDVKVRVWVCGVCDM